MFQILNIDESFNNQMLQINNAAPIEANGLMLLFDKSPDILEVSRLKYTKSEHLGFFKDDELVGFASLGYFPGIIEGKLQQLFSLYNFYLKPEARGRRFVERAMNTFFTKAKENANFGYAITLKGNRPIESYVGNRIIKGMPPSRIIDDLIVKTILFSLPRKNTTSYLVRNARYEDIPDMVRLLNTEYQKRDFGLVYQEDTFSISLKNKGLAIENYYVAVNSKGLMVGVCLAWDCSSFRRTKVIKYSSNFYPALYGYKLLEKIFPMAPFPRNNECFSELTITDCAVAERNATIMHALLSEIYHRNLNRKYHFMNVGSCASDPILLATKGFWHKEIRSHIIFTSLDTDRFNYQPQLPYVDIALL
jgi:hypothetical protein